MMDVWPDVGVESGWLGGPGESWERGPYYARGLVALAHVLGDQRLAAMARPWVDWSLASQDAGGFFGPRSNDDWWARMPMLDALRLHHEATGDPRVPQFMTAYFRHQLGALPARPLADWGRARGADNADHALWLYNRTGEAFLLELADLLHAQTTDWLAELGRDGPPSDAFELAHGVNRAMGLKAPAVRYQRSHDPAHLAAVRRGWEQTMLHHGQLQGTYSCDELLHGRGPTQGTELCTIVELIASLTTVLGIGGELWCADALERIAYNALPAMLSSDLRTHQYFQLTNQVACVPGPHRFWYHHETDLLFGVAPGYGCCAANLHLAWPGVVHHSWWATRERGLAALVLGPSTVTAEVAGGRVTVVEETDYPFAGDVRFVVRAAAPLVFPLTVRIPAWATTVEAAVNGRRIDDGGAGQLLVVGREWRDGDALEVRLGMEVRASRWEGGGIGLERGPLVYALPIGEAWRQVGGTAPFADYEVHPTTRWNYGLVVDAAAPGRSVRVTSTSPARQPWTPEGAPVRLEVAGRRLPGWTIVDGPVPGDEPDREEATQLTLVPFGCTRLRIAIFPDRGKETPRP